MGRAHTEYKITGTESGRTSTSIFHPCMKEKFGLALQTMTHYMDPDLDVSITQDLRSMFVADPGYALLEWDYAQAEDRVVQVLARDWEALKELERTDFVKNRHKQKDDRHTKTTMMIMSRSFDDITSNDRQIGKKVRHAGNYDMGKHACMINLAGEGVFLSEWKCGQLLDKFHATNPAIRGVFHKEIQEALAANNCVLFSPHRRRRVFMNRWGTEMFKEAYASIPQATVSDANKFSLCRIRKQLPIIEFEIVMESHDSGLALVRLDLVKDAMKVIKKEAEEPIDFSQCSLSRNYELVIPIEFKIGERWSELEAV